MPTCRVQIPALSHPKFGAAVLARRSGGEGPKSEYPDSFATSPHSAGTSPDSVGPVIIKRDSPAMTHRQNLPAPTKYFLYRGGLVRAALPIIRKD